MNATLFLPDTITDIMECLVPLDNSNIRVINEAQANTLISESEDNEYLCSVDWDSYDYISIIPNNGDYYSFKKEWLKF